MTRAAGSVLAAVLLAACSGPTPPWSAAPSQPLDLRLQVAPTTVGLLQPVEALLDLWTAAEVEAEFAPAVAAADFLATTTRGRPQPLFGGRWTRFTLVLQPVRPGELVLPPFVARQRGGDATASTAELRLTVTPALPAAAGEPELEQVLADGLDRVGEPFATPAAVPWGWLAAGGAALLLGGLWLVAHRRRPVRVHPDETALPPHTKALRALHRLRHAPRTTPAQVDAFYVEVSGVLRTYLEERFGLCAPERTTEEFLRELENGDRLARAHRAELERFLSQCDLVKFAAVVPGEAEHLATWAAAEAFVEATRPDRRSTEAAP